METSRWTSSKALLSASGASGLEAGKVRTGEMGTNRPPNQYDSKEGPRSQSAKLSD